MSTFNRYAELVLPLHLDNTFTYRIPEKHKNPAPGTRVIVQFGKKKLYTALVWKTHNQKPEYEIKEIIEILDDTPILQTEQMKLWEWMASYYMCTLGDLFKAALPAGFKLESETKVVLTDVEHINETCTGDESKIISYLEKTPYSSINDLGAKLNIKNPLPLINKMSQDGILDLEEKLKDSVRPKPQIFYSPSSKMYSLHEDQLNNMFIRAPKQLEVLKQIISLSDSEHKSEISRSILLNEMPGIDHALRALISKKAINKISKDPVLDLENSNPLIPLKKLNNAQKKALSEIREVFNKKDSILLHGVTSSGKTEIYAHLIQEQLDKGHQVLYLVPEIALTTQLIRRLGDYFGTRVGVYHSKYSDSDRISVWKELEKGEHSKYKIILGARSAIFLPFKSLGLIIVDEEHENSYKQYDPAPRYHARDTAILMTRIHRAKALLGTASPSLETYFNALNGKYGWVELFARHKDLKLPEIKIVDTRKAYKQKQMHSHFSSYLLDEMEEALAKSQQIILFQNRRGYSPYIECHDCGWIPGCSNCDVSYTYHKKGNFLSCHYCGASKNTPAQCPECGSSNIRTRGFGTEKVEDEIKQFFPDARLIRMDLDTTRSRKKYESIISGFESHQYDILIGTQMVTKGLDFDKVSVVGILNADNMLNFPDFRAFERSFQLITQVSGRAGRKEQTGRVIIQTVNPTHPVLNYVITKRHKEFMDKELAERKEYIYPPMFRMIKISLKAIDRQTLSEGSLFLKHELSKMKDFIVLGPQDPLVPKIQKYYIKTIIIKIKNRSKASSLKEELKKKIQAFLSIKDYKRINCQIDVDPI